MDTGTGDMIRLWVEAGLPEPNFGIRNGFPATIARSRFEWPLRRGLLSKPENNIRAQKTSGKTSGKRQGKTAKAIVGAMKNNPGIAVDLQSKVAAQKRTNDLEHQRNHKKQTLFDAQDRIKQRKDSLISDVEARLQQQTSAIVVMPMFCQDEHTALLLLYHTRRTAPFFGR